MGRPKTSKIPLTFYLFGPMRNTMFVVCSFWNGRLEICTGQLFLWEFNNPENVYFARCSKSPLLHLNHFSADILFTGSLYFRIVEWKISRFIGFMLFREEMGIARKFLLLGSISMKNPEVLRTNNCVMGFFISHIIWFE